MCWPNLGRECRIFAESGILVHGKKGIGALSNRCVRVMFRLRVRDRVRGMGRVRVTIAFASA